MSIAEGMHLWKAEIKWQCWSVAGAVREPRYVLTGVGGVDFKKLRYETVRNRKAGFDDSRRLGKLSAASSFHAAADCRRAAQNRRRLACGQLSFRRPDLSVR